MSSSYWIFLDSEGNLSQTNRYALARGNSYQMSSLTGTISVVVIGEKS